MVKKDSGTLGGCMLPTLSIVFSLRAGIQEREKCVLVAQLCPTLCSTMDCSLPNYSVLGILQARILEWVAISFSRRNDQGGSKVTQGTSPSTPKDPIPCVSCSVVSDYLQLHGLSLPRLLCPWDSPGKNTGVGCHFLLQGIFPT